MLKNRRTIVAALIALIALMVIWFGALRSNEPRYNGKTVSEWLATPDETRYTPPNVRTRPSGLRETVGRESSELPYNPGIREMLDALGTNAIPALLGHLREGRSVRIQLYTKLAASTSLPAWVKNFAASNLLAPLAMVHRASSALRYLGPDAAAAIPELEQLTGAEFHHIAKHSALVTLAGLQTEGWKAIGRVLKNASPANRTSLQGTLVASSSRILRGGNLRLRAEAALTLCHLDSPPVDVIPVLGDVVDSGEPARTLQALHGLEKMATNHVTARDVIRRAARSEDPEIRGLAQSILDRAGYTNAIARQ